MSNDVYGYVFHHCATAEVIDLFSDAESKFGLGISEITKDELYNFPEKHLPKECCCCFLVSDRAGGKNADLAIDLIDYEGDIGLPSKGLERLNLVINFLLYILANRNVCFMAIALTDSSNIEEVKAVSATDFTRVLKEDFGKYSPPDILYLVSK